jgi:hypothetical protein
LQTTLAWKLAAAAALDAPSQRAAGAGPADGASCMSENDRPLTPEEIVRYIGLLDPEGISRLSRLLIEAGYLPEPEVHQSLLELNNELIEANRSMLVRLLEISFQFLDAWTKTVESLTRARKSAAKARAEDACADAIIELHDGPEKLSFGKIRRRLVTMDPKWGNGDGAPKSVDAVKKLYRRRKQKLAWREAAEPTMEKFRRLIDIYARLTNQAE